jgi:TonB family protein
MISSRAFSIPVVMAMMVLSIAFPALAQGLASGNASSSMLGLAEEIRYPQSALAQQASGAVLLDLVVRSDGKVSSAVTDSSSPKIFADAVIDGVRRVDFTGWSVGAPETAYTLGIIFKPGDSAAGWVSVEKLERADSGGSRVILRATGKIAGSTIHDDVLARQMKLFPPDEFVAVDEEPKWDQADLSRRIKYPDHARRANREGEVFVIVLVDARGTVVKYMLDRSSGSSDLDYAAVEAVVGTHFVPARVKGVPVPVWIMLPVNFRLK